MSRFSLAVRCFMDVLSGGGLSERAMADLRLVKRSVAAAQPAPAARPSPDARAERASDGAVQLLAILQRDSRLVDFLMEDISQFSDDQVGAAMREVHGQCRDSLKRHVQLEPVIDGVENTYAKAPSGARNLARFVGNIPATPPEGGMLRHRGWRAAKVDLPAQSAGQDVSVVAPAELEVE